MRKFAFIPLTFTLSSILLHADQMLSEEQDNDTTYTTRTAVVAITEKNVHGTRGGKNPSHLRSKGPFVTADFLYWRGDFDGLEVATKNEPHSSSYELSNADFRGEWRPGVRAGLGWLFGAQDEWDLYANWTFFYDKANSSEASKNFTEFNYLPTWSNILGPLSFDFSGNWNLHFNMIDLEIGRDYFISRKISLRPHVGLRGGWIKLNYNAAYKGLWTLQTIPGNVLNFAGSKTSFEAESTFQGLGVRGGFDFFWHFTTHFGISSRLSGALLYGSFDINETFNGAQPAGINAEGIAFVDPLKVTYSTDFNRVRANIDAFLGLFFETGISNDKYHFTIQAGYELSEWFEQNELATLQLSKESQLFSVGGSIPPRITTSASDDFVITSKSGNLGMQGLTVKFAFNF